MSSGPQPTLFSGISASISDLAVDLRYFGTMRPPAAGEGAEAWPFRLGREGSNPVLTSGELGHLAHRRYSFVCSEGGQSGIRA